MEDANICDLLQPPPSDPRDAAIERLLGLVESATTAGRAYESTQKTMFDLIVSLSNAMNRAAEMRRIGQKRSEREIYAGTRAMLNSYIAEVAGDVAQFAPWPDMDEVRRDVQQTIAPPGDESA